MLPTNKSEEFALEVVFDIIELLNNIILTLT